MSGYFDALMRSSGITVGGPKRATAHLEPSAVDVEGDRSPTTPEARTVREASTLQAATAPVRIADAVDPTVLPRAAERVDRYAHEESGGAQAHTRGAPDRATDLPMLSPARSVESPKPDHGPTLVRAATRWVAAGTSQVRDVAQVGPGREQSLPVVHEDAGVISMTKVLRDDDDAPTESPGRLPTTVAAPNVEARKLVAAKTLPSRSALVSPAPPSLVAPLVRDEIVEVSIGAIHVRVDAPPAQIVARPAATSNAGPQRAAGATPARSALSRRALRRI